MGFEFLARTIRATALTACVAAVAAAVAVDVAAGAAVLLGAAWALANLKLLELLVRALGPKGAVEPLRAALALLLKGPVLYCAGWLLLASGLPAAALLAGFGLPLLLVTLLGVGSLLAPRRRPLPAAGADLRARLGRGAGRLGALALVLSALALPAGEARAIPAGTEAPPAETHAPPAADPHAPAATDPHAAPPAAGGHGADDAHAAGAHAGHAEHPELPNFITFLRAAYAGKEQPAWLRFLHTWENVVFSLIAAGLLILVFGLGARPKRMVPRGLQNLAEALLGGLHDFFLGILGPEGRKYVPFVGTLFLYIVTMNWMGLLPFMKAPTSSLNTTLALSLCVFVYVQYIGISKNGLGGYLYHFAGQPKDAIGWGTAILLFPLEVMGELIKPVSLAARLFGNILSEDILLAVLVGLGVVVLSAMNSPIGLPLQLPFLVLSTLFGLIQGLVFSLLASIYIVMMLPHDDHGHHEDHAGAQVAHH
jgi:F-type H+-transporting ATPase subunit a